MAEQTDAERAIELNRVSWDVRVPVHLRSSLYRPRLDALRRGESPLDPPADTEIGDVTGKSVLHLHCHIGTDTLALAQRGAKVTGLDFSEQALTAARALATQLGYTDDRVDFVQADATEADRMLHGRSFDIVLATMGVLCWVPDLMRWMASAANLVAPGGHLYLADLHPLSNLFEDDADSPQGISVQRGYFPRGPESFPPGPTYADDGGNTAMPTTVEYFHTLGEVVNAVIATGLRLEYLHEWPTCLFRRFGAMTTDDGVCWHMPAPLRDRLPMMFSLRACRD